MMEALSTVREGFSPRDIKMAIGIASDKRYAGHNMTGAVDAIEKIKKGLSDHPQVAAVLKSKNEETEDVQEGRMKELHHHVKQGKTPEEIAKIMKLDFKTINALVQESVDLEEMQAKLNSKGQIEMTKAKYAKVHKDYKTVIKGTSFAMQLDPKTGGSALFPVKFVTEDTESLDEAKKVLSKKGDYVFYKDTSKDLSYVTYKGKIISSGDFDQGADAWFMSTKGTKGQKSFDKPEEVIAFFTKNKITESLDELDEAKSYDLYHKTFSAAMQHSYEYAKKKFGIEIDPEEIDSKVAMGPSKPKNGKTNSYRLKGKNGKGIQVQVYNTGNSFELNMYKESVEMDEAFSSWTVTAVKTVNKVKKGDSKTVKAQNAGQALKKSAKAWGDEMLNTVPSTYFKVTKEEVESVELDEAISNSTMYGVVVKGKYIAKGSKDDMKKLAKEKGGKLMNAPSKKVGDSAAKVSEEFEESFIPLGMFNNKGAKHEAYLAEAKQTPFQIMQLIVKTKSAKKIGSTTVDLTTAGAVVTAHTGAKSKPAIQKKIEGDSLDGLLGLAKMMMSRSESVNEMKMNDPKLLKIFDALKRGSTVNIKSDSSIAKGTDYQEYIVKSKNVVNKGKVEKITMVSKLKPASVKRYLYKRDDKVTMATGDMAVSIVDIKEGVESDRDDSKKTRIASLQLQIAKAQQLMNKLNNKESK